jgi:hypothetical protein
MSIAKDRMQAARRPAQPVLRSRFEETLPMSLTGLPTA